MKTLLLVGVSCLLLASPAMSATYYIGASATGGPQPDIIQDTPLSLSGAGEGATFTGNATDANGGTASAFASEGISNVTDYNNSLYSHYYGIDGGVTSVVKYTIRVSGPVTGNLSLSISQRTRARVHSLFPTTSTPPSSPARARPCRCNTRGTIRLSVLSIMVFLLMSMRIHSITIKAKSYTRRSARLHLYVRQRSGDSRQFQRQRDGASQRGNGIRSQHLNWTPLVGPGRWI